MKSSYNPINIYFYIYPKINKLVVCIKHAPCSVATIANKKTLIERYINRLFSDLYKHDIQIHYQKNKINEVMLCVFMCLCEN